MPDPRETIESGDLHRRLMRGNIIGPQTVLIAKAAFEAAGGFDERLRNNEDWDFFIRLAEQGPIGFLDDPLVVVLISEDGISRRNRSSAASFVRVYGKIRRKPRPTPALLAYLASQTSTKLAQRRPPARGAGLPAPGAGAPAARAQALCQVPPHLCRLSAPAGCPKATRRAALMRAGPLAPPAFRAMDPGFARAAARDRPGLVPVRVSRCPRARPQPPPARMLPRIGRPTGRWSRTSSTATARKRIIRAAIESVLAQTYQPLEIVLSDDCSPTAPSG